MEVATGSQSPTTQNAPKRVDGFCMMELLQHNAELAFFLTLGGGYLVGRIKLGTQRIGAVLGVLIVGLVVGQSGVVVDDNVKWIFFYFFLFAIGYKCGPQFIHGLRSSGLVQVGLTLLFVVVALACAYITVRLFNFDAGTGVGMFAGALTASATLGVAADAISRMPISQLQQVALQSNLAIAFATSYLIGVVITVWFLSRIGPRIIRSNVAQDCKKLENEMGVTHQGETHQSAYREVTARAYVIGDRLVGVGQLEESFLPGRVFVARIRRGGAIIEPTQTTELMTGDVVVLAGREEFLVSDVNPLQHSEVSDRELLEIPTETISVVVTNEEYSDRLLADIAKEANTRGVFLMRHERAGHELPRSMQNQVMRGDRLTLSGHSVSVARVGQLLGRVDKPVDSTDIVAVGVTIVLGGAIGIPALHVGNLELGLGVSVGILIGGLVLGWLQSIYRVVAPIPSQVLWFFDSVGLTGFVAVTALTVGPLFIQSIQQTGVALVVGSLAVTVIPHAVVLLVGRYLLKVHPGILLGISAGAGTSAPSLAAIQEVAKSTVPTLGYGVTYALGNILLALCGSIIIALLT